MESEVISILRDANRDMKGVVGQTMASCADFFATEDEGRLPALISALDAAQEAISHYLNLRRRASEAIAKGPIKAVPFRPACHPSQN